MTLYFLVHTPTLHGVTVSDPDEMSATFAALEFQAQHPSAEFGPVHPAAEFGPVHPAAGAWVTHGRYNPKDA